MSTPDTPAVQAEQDTQPAATCCTAAPAKESAQQAPCCGTVEDASDAGSCCGPAAETEAQAAGSGFC
ncbi:hypothetical protein AB0K51_31715 [Kitasatospora sp. NPDC049285]|uniref:hypothetical protein n=1 Tax=Kitasatospora sp. NPDC049285 TaxID=3157096 RepID=UPI00343C4304